MTGATSPPPRSRLITPGTIDPAAPTLHTCGGCGFQMLIAYGFMEAVAQQHSTRCLGPRLDAVLALLNRLAGIESPAEPEVTA